MNGVPMQVVSENLGHADTRMVEKHYGHLAPSHKRDAIRAGAARFGLVAASNVRPLRWVVRRGLVVQKTLAELPFRRSRFCDNSIQSAPSRGRHFIWRWQASWIATGKSGTWAIGMP